jgi:cold shock CspA family protein
MDVKIDKDEIYTGKVVHFIPQKGFGYIRSDVYGLDDVFIHYTEIEVGGSGFKNLLVGDVVTFKIAENGTVTDRKTGKEKMQYKAMDLHIVRTVGAN